MLRGNDHEGGAKDRIWPGRVDLQASLERGGQRKVDLGTLTAADPFLLHRPCRLRPVDVFEPIEQPMSVSRVEAPQAQAPAPQAAAPDAPTPPADTPLFGAVSHAATSATAEIRPKIL